MVPILPRQSRAVASAGEAVALWLRRAVEATCPEARRVLAYGERLKATAMAKSSRKSAGKFSHYDKRGRVRMVDVSAKQATTRIAEAHAFVRMGAATIRQIRRLQSPKGNPLEIARIAGIAAAKRTSDLIPLCHPLPLTHIDVRAELCQNGIEIRSQATSTGPTGVEMEALVGAAVAALTVYDMCKAIERGIEITELYLLRKTGGRSGEYFRGAKGGRK